MHCQITITPLFQIPSGSNFEQEKQRKRSDRGESYADEYCYAAE